MGMTLPIHMYWIDLHIYSIITCIARCLTGIWCPVVYYLKLLSSVVVVRALLVVHRPKTSCTYFPQATLRHRPTDHRQEQFSILKYEEVLIFCHATLPTTMRVVLRGSIYFKILGTYFCHFITCNKKFFDWYTSENTMFSHIKCTLIRFLKMNSFLQYQHQLETLHHWMVRVHPGCPHKKSILIISYHDVKMVSWIRL